jgi:hypothetical protein
MISDICSKSSLELIYEVDQYGHCPYLTREAHGGVVVEALCYKPEGRGFESR